MSYWKEDIGWAEQYRNYLPAPSGLRRPGYKNELPGSPSPRQIPALLGVPPRAGFDHPQYPRVLSARKDPEQTYRSQIDTRAPLDSAVLSGLMDAPTAGGDSGASAAGRSASAFARSLTDTTNANMGAAADQFNQQYRQQAENARADDIRAQRANVFDRYRMDVSKDIFDTDLMTKYKTDIKTKEAYRLREVKNARNSVAAAAIGMIGGLL